MPPGADMDDWWTFLRSGTWRLHYQLSLKGRQRYFAEFLPLLHDTKHEVMGERDDDCYYLVYIGTKPNARKRGYARKLMESMIECVRYTPLDLDRRLITPQREGDGEGRGGRDVDFL